MLQPLQRASATLFYILGLVVLALIVLKQTAPIAVLDLPLIFFGLLYGGTALLGGGKREPSVLATTIVGVCALLLFSAFLWLNFGFPHQSLVAA